MGAQPPPKLTNEEPPTAIMVCLIKRIVLAAMLMVSCSAAAAITFFFAPLWGLMLLSVPIFLGVYLCIVRPLFLVLPSLMRVAYSLLPGAKRRRRSPGIPR